MSYRRAATSVDVEEPYFKEFTYWRGPVWVNTNWMIYLGLLKYGQTDVAGRIKQGILELVTNHGFREYCDAYTGQGLGGKSFSWTACFSYGSDKEHWNWNSPYIIGTSRRHVYISSNRCSKTNRTTVNHRNIVHF